jgi:hypothetical protein
LGNRAQIKRKILSGLKAGLWFLFQATREDATQVGAE